MTLIIPQIFVVMCNIVLLYKHITALRSILTFFFFLFYLHPLCVLTVLCMCVSSLLQLVLSGPVMYYNNIHTPPLAFSPHAAHSPIASHPTHPAHTPHTPLATHPSSHPQYPAQPFIAGMPFPFRPSHWKKWCLTCLRVWKCDCVWMSGYECCCHFVGMHELMYVWEVCIMILLSTFASGKVCKANMFVQ